MKKFLAFFLAITVVFSMTAMFTTVGASGVDGKNIPYIDYLDFSGEYNSETKQWTDNNQWANRNDDGTLKHTSFSGSQYVDENGVVPEAKNGKYYPHALYLESSDASNGYNKNLDMEFTQNGEVLRLTATDTNNPAIAFQVSTMETYAIGSQNDGELAEYIKIRFKNNSPSTKLTFMGTNKSWGNYAIDRRVRATIDVEPNSAEWQTITISMVEGTQNTTGSKAWSSYLKSLAIFPFGYDKDNEAIVNDKYYMEIDYIVIGSKEYVDSYQSALEQKELAAETFEFVNKPAKTEYFLGETIDLTGLEAKVEYIEDKYPDMVADGNSVSAVYNFDKPEDAAPDAKSWTSTVTLMYGTLNLKYDVTVYDIEKIELEYETDKATDVDNKVYDRFSVRDAGSFTPTGIKVKVTYTKTDKDGAPITALKEMYEVDLEGTDFSETVKLNEKGYYEYLVTINYHGADPIYLPIKLIEVSELVVTPVADKADKIYYGTEINASYFDIVCKYTNGDEKPLADSGLASYLSVSGNTKTTGGATPITLVLENTAFEIHVDTVVDLTVQTPKEITVKLALSDYDVDKVIPRDDFSVKYTYEGGATATVDKGDPNLVFNYDTSVPGEHTGVVKIGDKSAEFKYKVNDAKFKVEPLVRDGSKVDLLASKIPTSLVVSLICLAVVLVIVGIWALLKFVFKVDFKRKKRVSLDDIF